MENQIEISKEAEIAIDKIRKHIESLPEDKRPLVAIDSITYNHEAFIRDTLEGFIMQQTDFPFVAIVHDDASTDGTAAIILEYAEKYPDIIFPIIEKENQYRKPGGPLTMIMHEAESATCAKYIATCEGDDYWIDPLKLQKQVDFLESHPDYVMCSTRYKMLDMTTNVLMESKPRVNFEYDYNWLLNNETWPMATLNVMYRREAMIIEEFLRYRVRYDVVSFWYLLHKGKGYMIDDFTAIYRIHGDGVWSRLSMEEMWDFDYNYRFAIHEVEKNKESMKLLRNNIRRHIGRKTVLTKKRKELFYIFKEMVKYDGLFPTLSFFVRYVATRPY